MTLHPKYIRMDERNASIKEVMDRMRGPWAELKKNMQAEAAAKSAEQAQINSES